MTGGYHSGAAIVYNKVNRILLSSPPDQYIELSRAGNIRTRENPENPTRYCMPVHLPAFFFPGTR